MINYVVGFIFDKDYSNVLLIRKNRPEWQKGWLNGIGGSIEINENPINAMIRECKEETGLEIENWEIGPVVICPDFQIYYFYTSIDRMQYYYSPTDELVIRFSMRDLPIDIISPSSWILKMCADSFVENKDIELYYSVNKSR